MTHIHYVPINELPNILEGSWASDSALQLRHALNPWKDDFVDRCQLARFNLQRAIHVRGPDMMHYLWSNMTHLDECRIEAERDALQEQYDDIYALERAYICDTYLDSELESWKVDQLFRPAVVDLSTLPTPFDSVYPYVYDCLTGFFQPGHPARTEYNRAVMNQTVPAYQVKTASAAAGDFAWYRLHFDTLGPLNHAVTQSMQHLLFELYHASVDSNVLSGAAAKGRALLSNEGVPLPNDYTFLAWWNHCGIGFVGLNARERETVYTIHSDRPLSHMISFILPCLPMSREHRSGHQLLGDDSHADHSLSFKSAGHDRLPHGGILHGRWEAYTYLCQVGNGGDGADSGNYLVARERIKDGQRTGLQIASQHSSMLPYFRPFIEHWAGPRGRNQDVFLPGLRIDDMMQLSGVVNDPYLTYPQPLAFHTSGSNHAFDVGMRSLGKFHRVHFRFTDDEFGALAATEWCAAFIDCAIRYARRSVADHARVQFESARIRSIAVRRTDGVSTRGKSAIFDLSAFQE